MGGVEVKIAAIGDNVIDRYLNKDVMYPGGNAVNVAAHASMLGAQAAYIGEIGNDLGGRIITDALSSLNVDLSQSSMPEKATTKTCDVNVYNGERVEVGYDTGACWAHKTHITDSDVKFLQGFDAVFTSVNAKLQDDVHLVQDLPAVVVYDFSVKDKYRTDAYFDLVCPATTLGLFSCSGESDQQIQVLLKRAIEHGCRYTIATRGSAGPVFFDGSRWYQGNIRPVDALDTMGAGDSYVTAFVVSCLSRGWSKKQPLDAEIIRDAMEFAADYSAKNCLKPGGFGFEHKLAEMKDGQASIS